MVEASFGLVFGFTVFLFIVAAFLIGLVLYVIYLKCCTRKEKSAGDFQDKGDIVEEVKVEGDGASWAAPLTDLDDAITYAENSLERPQNGSVATETALTADEVIEEEPPPSPQPSEPDTEPLDEEAAVTEVIPEEPEVSNPPLEEEAEVATPVIPDPPAGKANPAYDDPEDDFREGNVYAKVQQVSRADVQEESPPKPKIGKLYHRLSVFESASQSSSLVRPSRKSQYEGIRSNSVADLVTEFQASDSILLGRQLTKEPGSSFYPVENKTAERTNNNNNNITQSRPTTTASQDSLLDLDTGEPLYSVPNLSKKSSRRSERSRPVIAPQGNAEKEAGDGEGSDLVTPALPPKSMELL